MRLNPLAFNAFIAHIGQRIAWRRARDCPCRDPYSGGADSNCPHCAGSGQLWSAAIDSLTGLSGQKIQREWAALGLWESGDVVITLPSDTPAYAMGEFDRVVFTDSSEAFSTLQTRGSETPLPAPITLDSALWIDGEGELAETSALSLVSNAVVWASVSPPAGTQYTLNGRKHPEYYCYRDFPQDRAHHGGSALPRRVVLRRFDLFGRTT